MIKVLITILIIIWNNITSAAPGKCTVTITKSNCWVNYDVQIKILDTSKNKKIATISINKGEITAKQDIPCSSGQTLKYLANFQPAIWQEDKNKNYYSKQYIQIPEGNAWKLIIDFPNSFNELPEPINGGC